MHSAAPIGEAPAGSPSTGSQLSNSPRAELEAYKREFELACSELGAEEATVREFELRRRLEIQDIRQEVRSLASRVSAAYRRGVEDSAGARTELAAVRDRLDAARSELANAEAEAQFLLALQGFDGASASAASSFGPGHDRQQTMSQSHDSQNQSEMAVVPLQEEYVALQGVVHDLQEEVQESAETSSMLRSEHRELQEAFAAREYTAAAYETRAARLRRELTDVLEQLRVSHEIEERERQRLEEHVECLEEAVPREDFRGQPGPVGVPSEEQQGQRRTAGGEPRIAGGARAPETVPWWGETDSSITLRRSASAGATAAVPQQRRHPPSVGAHRWSTGSSIVPDHAASVPACNAAPLLGRNRRCPSMPISRSRGSLGEGCGSIGGAFDPFVSASPRSSQSSAPRASQPSVLTPSLGLGRVRRPSSASSNSSAWPTPQASPLVPGPPLRNAEVLRGLRNTRPGAVGEIAAESAPPTPANLRPLPDLRRAG